MKKCIAAATLIFALLLVSCTTKLNINIPTIHSENEVGGNENVPQGEEKTVTMYAPDGRTQTVPESEVEANVAVGWYVEPVCTLYAADGRTQIVPTDEVEENVAVGWYTEPVCTLYAPDGRTQVVPKREAEANIAVGWYTEPVCVVRSADGRTMVIPVDEVQEYRKVGWYPDEPWAQILFVPKHCLPADASDEDFVAYANSYVPALEDFSIAIRNGAFFSYSGDKIVEPADSYGLEWTWVRVSQYGVSTMADLERLWYSHFSRSSAFPIDDRIYKEFDGKLYCGGYNLGMGYYGRVYRFTGVNRLGDDRVEILGEATDGSPDGTEYYPTSVIMVLENNVWMYETDDDGIILR